MQVQRSPHRPVTGRPRGTAIPAQACYRQAQRYSEPRTGLLQAGPEVQRSPHRPVTGRRFSWQSAHKSGKIFNLTHRSSLHPRIYSWLSRPQGHSAAGRIMSMTPSVIETTTFRLFASQPAAPLISATRTPRAAIHVRRKGFSSTSLESFAGTVWSGETPFSPPRPYLAVRVHSNCGTFHRRPCEMLHWRHCHFPPTRTESPPQRLIITRTSWHSLNWHPQRQYPISQLPSRRHAAQRSPLLQFPVTQGPRVLVQCITAGQ